MPSRTRSSGGTGTVVVVVVVVFEVMVVVMVDVAVVVVVEVVVSDDEVSADDASSGLLSDVLLFFPHPVTSISKAAAAAVSFLFINAPFDLFRFIILTYNDLSSTGSICLLLPANYLLFL